MIGVPQAQTSKRGFENCVCSKPAERVRESERVLAYAYFAKQADAQIQSVDNNLMRENDPRMPLFNDRKTKVTFGKGN